MLTTLDADMLESALQKLDLSKGLALVVSSPGGDGLAAERIINMCRNYSGTGEYWALVPSKAKSAATIVCFGASKILMGPTSELGAIDPQIPIGKDALMNQISVYNLIKSYEKLFNKAVKLESGHLEPYLQQLSRYDEREIEELRNALKLSEEIAIRYLISGMMKGKSQTDIKKALKIFLTPERTRTHGRPIYREEAKELGFNIEFMNLKSKEWELLNELYIRTNNFVSTKATKCVETKHRDKAFLVPYQG